MNEKPQKYIIRTDRAGVFYAEIAKRRGNEADLVNARRIYSWSGAATCSQISVDGVSPSSRITLAVPTMTVLGIIEFHPCSDKACASLDSVPEWKM